MSNEARRVIDNDLVNAVFIDHNIAENEPEKASIDAVDAIVANAGEDETVLCVITTSRISSSS